jgi:anhydro-N-acetylmuramic acid kinase
MLYTVIGLMSGSSLDGLDIVFAHLHFNGGKWDYEIKQKACYSYSEEWTKKLRSAQTLSAADYLFLHTEYGHYLGQQVNRFVNEYDLHFQVQLISSHGHTVFHLPGKRMTAQLGDGAAIAAETGINTISDLRSMDMALEGQGAPIVPIGEKFLLGDYPLYLNIGGIANISAHGIGNGSTPGEKFIAFDICPANRVLNLLASEKEKAFDQDGKLAENGKLNEALLQKLNELDYYSKPFPKSLDNSFGLDRIYPIITSWDDSIENKLCTYTEHISIQIKNSIQTISKEFPGMATGKQMLVCGGGGHNKFLISRLKNHLAGISIDLIIPEDTLMDFKEALIMAFIGVLRWREETNVLASVTGAKRDSIGGAIWMGQEA